MKVSEITAGFNVPIPPNILYNFQTGQLRVSRVFFPMRNAAASLNKKGSQQKNIPQFFQTFSLGVLSLLLFLLFVHLFLMKKCCCVERRGLRRLSTVNNGKTQSSSHLLKSAESFQEDETRSVRSGHREERYTSFPF